MYLAIETSSAISSVGLEKNGKIIGEVTTEAGLTHSVQLMPNIEYLLTMTKTKPEDIKGIVVSIGPGSFTGLRIGLGTAKALAYAWKIPLVGIKTTEALAYNAMLEDKLICVFIDAQKKNVYEALYRFEGKELIEIQEPTVKVRSEALHALATKGEAVVFLGDGAIMAAEEIREASPLFTLAPPTLQGPRAGALLLSARNSWESSTIDSIISLSPYYIRRSEAEVLWEKRQKEATHGHS